MECLNWPPSRGPNPHTHREVLEAGAVTRKILPAPPEPEIAVKERETVAALVGGDKTALAALGIEIPKGKKLGPFKVMRTFSIRQPAPRVLAGRWKVWYQVSDVLGLTLEQASNFITACRLDGKRTDHEHFDFWWDYAPRSLWVDIVYPLKRGVRLLVKPMLRAWSKCDTCGNRRWHDGKKEPRLTPGYLLWTVAREYAQIYKEHEKYGVWGHAIEDLGFESITIEKDGVVRLGIGS
jgi:hypothetical protein